RQRRLMKLMKLENEEVRKYCGRRDWKTAELWLNKNKMSFKAFRKIEKL
ncbi:unnamed protein product, partial [marine sediment metagenome]